ncbi:MAG: type III-A CRISPR-associated protein Csm2 [Cyanobacteriota bacterium]
MSTTIQSTKLIKSNFFEDQNVNLNDLGRDFVIKYFKKEGKIIISTSQIRKFLSGVNAMQNQISVLNKDDEEYENKWTEISNEIQYLRIKLAYQAGRADKDKAVALKNMREEMDTIIKIINNPDKFKKFSRLIEAIVAYHKFEGGE